MPDHDPCRRATPAALHYLKAVADMGVAAAKAAGAEAVKRMKAMPTDDDAFGAGQHPRGRPQAPPAYLFEVKKPGEQGRRGTTTSCCRPPPAEEAFRPLAEGGCPLVRS